VVKDAGGNLVADGTVVTFRSSPAGNHDVSGTTVNGIVTASFTSTIAAPVVVQAKTNGFYITDQNTPTNDFVTILFTPTLPDPSKSYVIVIQDNAIANAASQDIVQAVVNNSAGQPVSDGTVGDLYDPKRYGYHHNHRKTVGGIATATFTSNRRRRRTGTGQSRRNDAERQEHSANNSDDPFHHRPPVPGDPLAQRWRQYRRRHAPIRPTPKDTPYYMVI